MTFKDRKHAGFLLAPLLAKYRDQNPLILALPRGGVPVANELASRLEIPWNILVVRKIGAPFHSELAIGAICENEEPFFNERLLIHMGLTPEDLDRVIASERREIHRQVLKFRNGQELGSLNDRCVILVDDGLATGATVLAAVQYLNKKGASPIVVAVPIAAASSAQKVRNLVSEMICYEERDDMFAVSNWYEDFSQVTDDEVIECLKSQTREKQERLPHKEEFSFRDGSLELPGQVTTVPQMKAMIVFAHGAGSSRFSPRNQVMAQYLNMAGFATYLFDLLTPEEFENRENVFDIQLLSRRLNFAIQQLKSRPAFRELPFGLFGASTGAGAALTTAAQLASEDPPFAVVSRGGRVDLAGESLHKVKSPTLLIVGENDPIVLELNQEAQMKLGPSELVIIPQATHLFEEPGALEQVGQEAAFWFTRWLPEKPYRYHPHTKSRGKSDKPHKSSHH